MIIHARRDVESISTYRTKASHRPCVIVLKVSDFPDRSPRGVLLALNATRMRRAHNLSECEILKILVFYVLGVEGE